jgi:hypothetical protein
MIVFIGSTSTTSLGFGRTAMFLILVEMGESRK